MSSISNGHLSSKAVLTSARDDSNLFVRVGAEGNSEIVGDLIVGGTLYVDTIEPVSTTEPVYIKAPNELGGNTDVNNSALVVEGGENRLDLSQAQVTMSLYKPFTRGTVDYVQGEQLGSLSMWGKDTSDNDTKYVDIRGVITNPTNGAEESRINFAALKGNNLITYLQIDSSENIVKTLNSAKIQAMGNLIALADISCNGDIYVGDDLIVGDDIICADISCNATLKVGTTINAGGNITAGSTSSLFSRQQTIQSTTTSGGLGGVLFTVDNNNAGRINSDATNMQITGLTSPGFTVRMMCDQSGALACSKGSGATAGHMNAEFGTVDCSKTILTVRDKTSQYYVSNSYSVLISQGGGTAFPANGSTDTFTPNFSGRYTFEATYLFSVSGDISNSNIVLGFRVSGAGDDYGACLAAGKVVTLPSTDIAAFPYTISSGGHQLTAGTTYTITYIYQGAAGAKGGVPPIGANAGGYIIEAYYG